MITLPWAEKFKELEARHDEESTITLFLDYIQQKEKEINKKWRTKK